MNFKFPEIPNQDMARVLYERARLPREFWSTNVMPRFQTVTNAKTELQDAVNQAKVFNSLLHDPRQLLKIPRHWRVAAYSTPLEYAALTLGILVRYAVVHNMRVICLPMSELEHANKYHDRYDLVYVYDVFDDMESYEYRPLREAHFKPFHLMYAMTGTLADAVSVLKVSPDYAFQIQSAALQRQARTI